MRIWIDNCAAEVAPGVLLEELARSREEGAKIVLSRVDGKIRELHHPVREGEKVEFLTAAEKAGFHAVRRTLCFLLFAAIDEVLGEAAKTTLHFSVGDGLFFTIGKRKKISAVLCGRICQKMQEYVEADLPITKKLFPLPEARELFRERGMVDKEPLFRTRLSELVNVYFLGSYADYCGGLLASRTGSVGPFRLLPYEDGLLLLMPAFGAGDVIRLPSSQPVFFQQQRMGEEWASQRGVANVGDLNRLVINMGSRGAILVCEADQERRIADIAEDIAARKGVRFILIAGPSSSGKTTFSQRLCVQLVAHGVSPHYIGVDNYFLDRDKMIIQPDGTKDYEALSAIALDVFAQDMEDLLAGRMISLPKFDFLSGRRVDSGMKLQLGGKDVLIIEGIHCLNDVLTKTLPAESKYKIYLSALTQLNLDEHNHIPSSDGRLIRRIVRDHQTRGYTATSTLAMWDSVRRGEEKNIFPFQESADVFFNSALPYELGVLRPFVEPLLFQVEEESPQYPEARRLLQLLHYFLCIPGDDVPTNSILREFIGGGSFRI